MGKGQPAARTPLRTQTAVEMYDAMAAALDNLSKTQTYATSTEITEAFAKAQEALLRSAAFEKAEVLVDAAAFTNEQLQALSEEEFAEVLKALEDAKELRRAHLVEAKRLVDNVFNNFADHTSYYSRYNVSTRAQEEAVRRSELENARLQVVYERAAKRRASIETQIVNERNLRRTLFSEGTLAINNDDPTLADLLDGKLSLPPRLPLGLIPFCSPAGKQVELVLQSARTRERDPRRTLRSFLKKFGTLQDNPASFPTPSALRDEWRGQPRYSANFAGVRYFSGTHSVFATQRIIIPRGPLAKAVVDWSIRDAQNRKRLHAMSSAATGSTTAGA